MITNMSHGLTLLGVELLVQDIDRATELFEGALGFELVERRMSDDPAGEIAVFAVGEAALTVIAPRDHGPGVVIDDRTPRLGQLVLGASTGSLDAVATDVVERGGSVQPIDDQRFLLSPSTVAAATGIDAAITIVDTGA